MSPNSAAGGKDLSLGPAAAIHQEIIQKGTEEASRQINKHTGLPDNAALGVAFLRQKRQNLPRSPGLSRAIYN